MKRFGSLLSPDSGGGGGVATSSSSAAGGDTPAATPPAPQAGSSDTPAVDEAISLDEARKLRGEAASLRKRLKDLEAFKEQAETAQLDEQGKAQKTLADAQKARDDAMAALRKERASAAIARAAAKVGVAPDLAERLVDVEWDDAGNVVGVEAAVQALAARYPHLVTGTASSSPTNPPANRKGTLTVEDIRRMTPQEINARWDEVSAVMAASK